MPHREEFQVEITKIRDALKALREMEHRSSTIMWVDLIGGMVDEHLAGIRPLPKFEYKSDGINWTEKYRRDATSERFRDAGGV